MWWKATFLPLLFFASTSALPHYHGTYEEHLSSQTCNPDDLKTRPNSTLLADFQPCDRDRLCHNSECVHVCGSVLRSAGSACGFFATCELNLEGSLECQNTCRTGGEAFWKENGVWEVKFTSNELGETLYEKNGACGYIGNCKESECLDSCAAGEMQEGDQCGMYGICRKSMDPKMAPNGFYCSLACDGASGTTPTQWIRTSEIQFHVCRQNINGKLSHSMFGACLNSTCVDPCSQNGSLARYTPCGVTGMCYSGGCVDMCQYRNSAQKFRTGDACGILGTCVENDFHTKEHGLNPM